MSYLWSYTAKERPALNNVVETENRLNAEQYCLQPGTIWAEIFVQFNLFSVSTTLLQAWHFLLCRTVGRTLLSLILCPTKHIDNILLLSAQL